MRKRDARCTCGRLHIECRGEPIRISVCHCYACQRRTGSVFGAQARFRREHLTLEGEASTYVRTGDSGGTMAFSFCPVCGDTMSWHGTDDTEIVAIAVGAFADHTFPAPTVSVYEERRHPWVNVDAIPEHME